MNPQDVSAWTVIREALASDNFAAPLAVHQRAQAALDHIEKKLFPPPAAPAPDKKP